MTLAIDAHSHIWTPDTEKYPLAAGFFRGAMNPPSFTTEELLAKMKANDVGRCVLIQMSYYGYDNSYMTDAMQQYPGKFSGVAVIDQDGSHPEQEMLQLKKMGVRGFRIYPKKKPPAHWLDGECLQTMFTIGAKQKLAMCCLIDTNALPALDRMCRNHPQTPVVIDHMCRIGVSGQIEDKDVQALCQMARHSNVTVKISAFYALGKKQPPYSDLGPMIKKLHDAYGPERLMWATDGPFQFGKPHTYKASIDLIRSGLDFLTANDKEWLLHKTAERVFFTK